MSFSAARAVIGALVWAFTHDYEPGDCMFAQFSCPCAFILATPPMVAALSRRPRVWEFDQNVADLEAGQNQRLRFR